LTSHELSVLLLGGWPTITAVGSMPLAGMRHAGGLLALRAALGTA
jgi:hypothetical protein